MTQTYNLVSVRMRPRNSINARQPRNWDLVLRYAGSVQCVWYTDYSILVDDRNGYMLHGRYS